MKEITYKFGDLEQLQNGSRISVDSVSRVFRVKLDDYEAEAMLTDTEVEQLMAIMNKLKEINQE